MHFIVSFHNFYDRLIPVLMSERLLQLRQTTRNNIYFYRSPKTTGAIKKEERSNNCHKFPYVRTYVHIYDTRTEHFDAFSTR